MILEEMFNVIKNIIRTSFPLFHTFLKNVIVVPKLFDLFFSIDKIHVCRNFFVHDLLPFLLNNKKLPSCNRTKAYSPFGHMQMETVFIVVKGITMITVTVGLITNSINILFHGGRTVDFGVVAWFELFACVLGIIVTFYLKRKNKAMNSPLITVEMQGWKMDSMLSLGMTAVFFLPVFLPFKGVGQLTPYLDPFITIVLSMIMLPIQVKTVFTGIRR